MKKAPFKSLLHALAIFTCLQTSLVQAEVPQRIISTDAGNTELLLALGLQPQLIAIDVTSPQPDKQQPLPNIGYHRNLSAEGLMSLNPDTIIGSDQMGPEHVVTQLKKTPIDLIQLPAARQSAQLTHNIRRLSQQLDKVQQGEQLITELKRQLTQLDKQALKQETAIFLLAMDNKLRMAGRRSGGGALIDLLGARNIADYDNYRSISSEALLNLQPSMIIVAEHDTSKAVSKLLASHPMLKHTPAGQNNKILAVDGSSLVSGGLSLAAVDEALRLSQEISDRNQNIYKK